MRSRAQLRIVANGLIGQAANALANVAVSIAAARSLEPTNYGRFVLIYGLIILATSLQTAFVGDYIVVTGPDRINVNALMFWQHLLSAACGIGAALASGLVTQSTEPWTMICVAAATALWLHEEYGRRTLMASGRFLAQALNDAVYGTASISFIVVFAHLDTLNLATCVLSIAAGSFCAVLVAHLQLAPTVRLTRIGKPTPEGIWAVAKYGSWRSAQAGLGSLAQFLLRLIISSALGLAAVGTVEAARILVSPLATLFAGLSNVLLLAYARAERDGRRVRRGTATQLVVSLAMLTLLYGALLVTFATPLSTLLFGTHLVADQLSVVSWLVVAFTAMAVQPVLIKAMIGRAQSRAFAIRAIATLLTVGAGACIAVLRLPYGVIPLAFVVAPLVSALLLHYVQKRQGV